MPVSILPAVRVGGHVSWSKILDVSVARFCTSVPWVESRGRVSSLAEILRKM